MNAMNAMNGKRVVITGATSGIGRETARQLAPSGARLVLACRDVERGRRTADELEQVPGASEVDVLAVDTARQESVQEFAARCRDTYASLDVLINNAGVLSPRQQHVDGLELTFATNVLGYHLMTRELLDLLDAGAPARIVTVASAYAGELDVDDLQFGRRTYDGMKAYAQSKACNRLLTWALARRLEPTRVTANAMAPGLVLQTALYDDLPPEARQALTQMGSRTLAEGADTVAWLATSPDVTGVTGELFEQRRVLPCELRDPEAEEALWSRCEELVSGRQPARPHGAPASAGTTWRST
jgi:NAD(P)-dependent dehydrogenase (short-subunit alcohol dehydrogenase family)